MMRDALEHAMLQYLWSLGDDYWDDRDRPTGVTGWDAYDHDPYDGDPAMVEIRYRRADGGNGMEAVRMSFAEFVGMLCREF